MVTAQAETYLSAACLSRLTSSFTKGASGDACSPDGGGGSSGLWGADKMIALVLADDHAQALQADEQGLFPDKDACWVGACHLRDERQSAKRDYVLSNILELGHMHKIEALRYVQRTSTLEHTSGSSILRSRNGMPSVQTRVCLSAATHCQNAICVHMQPFSLLACWISTFAVHSCH